MAKLADTSRPPGEQRLTQYCPRCGYDLFGLPGDRCPECGDRFDRSSLPVVGAGEIQSRRSVWWLRAGAIGLALVHFSNKPGPENTAFQAAWLGLMWSLASAWVVLSWRELTRPGGAPTALWLLIPCIGSPGRPALPEPWETAAGLFALLVGIVVLVVALHSSRRRTAGCLMMAVSVILLLAGVYGMVFGLAVGLSVSDSSGAVFKLFTWEFEGTRRDHLLAAILGVLFVATGVAFLRWSRKLLA